MYKDVKVIVETGKDLYSCFIANSDDMELGIYGTGKTVRKAIKDFEEAYEEMKSYYSESGKEFPELRFEYVFDVGAFFNYYPINITAFAEYVGMNASLLRQYASGIKAPTEKTLKRIKNGIEKVSSDIGNGLLTDRPVTQYV